MMRLIQTKSDQDASPPAEALELASELHAAFGHLVAALPGRPLRPMDLARALGADKSVAHRLLTAVTKRPGLGVLLAMPGPAALAGIVASARRLGVDRSVCVAAGDAGCRFDSLVQTLAGDRASFDAMMSEWADDSRGQVDAAARQGIFRGMKHVLGIAAEVWFTTFLIHPAAGSPERVDLLTLDGILGLRRLRVRGRFCVTGCLASNTGAAVPTRALLEEFCSRPTPAFRTSGAPDRTSFVLEWEGKLGRAHPCDVVLSELRRDAGDCFVTDPTRPLAAVGCATPAPCAKAIVDVLLHRDVYPGCIPAFRVLTTGLRGVADPNDSTRDFDLIGMDCSIQALGTGAVENLLTPEVPFYARAIRSQCEGAGWDLAEFRAFRVRIDYPIFDSQMQYVIPRPSRAH